MSTDIDCELKIPILELPEEMTVDSYRILACAMTSALRVTEDNIERRMAVALSVVAVLDHELVRRIIIARPKSFYRATSKEFLMRLGATLTPADVPLPKIKFHLMRILLMAVSGRNFENKEIHTSMETRFKVFCNMVGFVYQPLGSTASFISSIGEGLVALNLVPTITRYAIDVLGKATPTAGGGLRAASPADVAARTQVLMCLEYGGLQSLKLSYAFSQGDTSQIWTLRPVVDQANLLIVAWNALLATGADYQYARMLGFSEASWETSHYPDVLYCAGYSCADKKASIKQLESWDKAETKVSRKLLQKLLSKQLEIIDAPGPGADDVVQQFLRGRNLQMPEVAEQNQLQQTMNAIMMMLRPGQEPPPQ